MCPRAIETPSDLPQKKKVLRCVPVSSKHHLIFPRNLRLFPKSLAVLENVRKCPETIVWTFDNFWRIFGNLTKVFGNLWKTVEKLVISLFVYIKRIRNSCLNFSSRVRLDNSLLHCAYSWDVKFNTSNFISTRNHVLSYIIHKLSATITCFIPCSI